MTPEIEVEARSQTRGAGFVVEILNRTPWTTTVTSVESDCACTSTDLLPHLIGPFQRAKLRFHYELPRAGTVTSELRFHTLPPAARPLKCRVVLRGENVREEQP